MRKILVIAVVIVSMFMVGCRLPTLEPYPTSEPRVIVVTPTPVPDEGWTCFTGKIELMNGTEWESGVTISIIGEQVICAKEWKISNLYGPVGTLESDPDNPLRFKDLNKMLESLLELPSNLRNSQ